MKKFWALLAVIAVIGGNIAYAEPIENEAEDYSIAVKTSVSKTTPSPKPEATAEPVSDTVIPEVTESPEPDDGIVSDAENTSSSLDFNIKLSKHGITIPSELTLELIDADNNLTLEFQHHADGNTELIHAHFDVPQYILGKSFELRLVSGLNAIKYNNELIREGESLIIETSGHTAGKSGDTFFLLGEPNYEKKLTVYIDNNKLNLSPRARLVNGSTLVPVRQICEALGLRVDYDKKSDSVTCSYGTHEMVFKRGSTECKIFGETAHAPTAPCYIDGSIYVPVRILAESVKSTVSVKEAGYTMDIMLTPAKLIEEYKNSSPVNKRGIDSRTSYLVWVNKSEFKTRVYLGSRYNWELLKEFDCAIGAPGTETITGEFEYIERLSSWDYNTYYVGPVMRFHNGYALHSTLLYYGGGEYDGTVRAKISHGCVRLHPEDINWICSYVPLKTKIYVTED